MSTNIITTSRLALRNQARFFGSFAKAQSRHCDLSKNVRLSNTLRAEDLNALFQGKITALKIPNFCHREAMDHAITNLQTREITDYENAMGVGKFKDVGMAYFEAENEDKKKEYYQQRLPSLAILREAFAPYLSPIDRVRVSLDEVWDSGAGLLNLGKGPMFTGLVRAIRDEILPHEDKLERDDPSALEKINYVAQVAFNCYIAVPDEGGALEIWNRSLSDEEYDDLRGDSYGIDRSLLPEPDVTIVPEKGDFIAFNGRNLHAVSRNKNPKQTRISVSGFLLYQGAGQPLKLWS